ncbi:YcxB family protein [Cohnella terricola]|uniref:YcxB family protein n=1 Tax=Cohnella terricola TaxID=1289167 RepID=A0A559JMQ3_9BACL|nr:YcxB family protein [Cohnella terricola]TVY01165.1 YcxB family protein [Cohnella terricola]
MIDITYKYSEYMTKAIRGFHHNSLKFWISNGLGAAIALAELILYFNSSNAKLLWIALIVLLLLAVTYYLTCVVQPARFASDSRYNKPFTLSIGETDLRLKSEDLDSQAAWSDIRKVWETNRFYYLFLDNDQFWVAPKDQFADKAQEERFREIASRHRPIRQGLIR